MLGKKYANRAIEATNPETGDKARARVMPDGRVDAALKNRNGVLAARKDVVDVNIWLMNVFGITSDALVNKIIRNLELLPVTARTALPAATTLRSAPAAAGADDDDDDDEDDDAGEDMDAAVKTTTPTTSTDDMEDVKLHRAFGVERTLVGGKAPRAAVRGAASRATEISGKAPRSMIKSLVGNHDDDEDEDDDAARFGNWWGESPASIFKQSRNQGRSGQGICALWRKDSHECNDLATSDDGMQYTCDMCYAELGNSHATVCNEIEQAALTQALRDKAVAVLDRMYARIGPDHADVLQTVFATGAAEMQRIFAAPRPRLGSSSCSEFTHYCTALRFRLGRTMLLIKLPLSRPRRIRHRNVP